MLGKVLGTMVAVVVTASLAHGAPPAPAGGAAAIAKKVERGRYLVRIAGCNDCHTAGYAAAAGKVPEAQWLLGDTLGWRGAWGTTYAANLRLKMSKVSEKEWIASVEKLQTRPPMPWFSLRDMTKADLAAIYRFIKQLGPAGAAAPAFVAPGSEPKPPFVQYPLPPKK